MGKPKGKRIVFVCCVCTVKQDGWYGQKFCSPECRWKYFGRNTAWQGLSKGTVGAIQELRVSTDLLSRGFEVFRSLSPSSSCDLLVLNEKVPLKIEVRTGYENPSTHKLYLTNQKHKADHLAIALPERIEYIPALPAYKRQTIT